MKIYLVTSKRTYSRAIIAAETEGDTTLMRPDDGAIWRNDRWEILRSTGTGFHRGGDFFPAPDSDAWPGTRDDLEAMEIGTAAAIVAADIWCHQPDTEPRT